MADEQAAKLAFLQNFYTNVTLYVPFEAHERAPTPAVPTEPLTPSKPEAVAPAPPVVLTPPAPAVAAPPLAVVAAPVVAAATGKLPSLAGLGEVSPGPAGMPVAPRAPLTPPAAPASAPPVATPAPAAAPSTPAPVAPYLLTTFDTLGANAQGVVLLVRLPPEQFVKLPRNVFLNKLLQAINLVMADVVLVNVAGPYPVALQNLRKEIAATHILAFGKNLLDVAVRTTQIYEPVQFPAVGLAYLAGAEIELIEYEISLKKRLWSGLQRMFLR